MSTCDLDSVSRNRVASHKSVHDPSFFCYQVFAPSWLLHTLYYLQRLKIDVARCATTPISRNFLAAEIACNFGTQLEIVAVTSWMVLQKTSSLVVMVHLQLWKLRLIHEESLSPHHVYR